MILKSRLFLNYSVLFIIVRLRIDTFGKIYIKFKIKLISCVVMKGSYYDLMI